MATASLFSDVPQPASRSAKLLKSSTHRILASMEAAAAFKQRREDPLMPSPGGRRSSLWQVRAAGAVATHRRASLFPLDAEHDPAAPQNATPHPSRPDNIPRWSQGLVVDTPSDAAAWPVTERPKFVPEPKRFDSNILTPEVLNFDLPSGRVESVPGLRQCAEAAMNECDFWSPKVDATAGLKALLTRQQSRPLAPLTPGKPKPYLIPRAAPQRNRVRLHQPGLRNAVRRAALADNEATLLAGRLQLVRASRLLRHEATFSPPPSEPASPLKSPLKSPMRTPKAPASGPKTTGGRLHTAPRWHTAALLAQNSGRVTAQEGAAAEGTSVARTVDADATEGN